MSFYLLKLTPNHFVYYTNIALNNLNNLGANILICVVWNRCAVVSIADKFYCCINLLKKSLGIYTGEYEACLIQRLRTFCACAYADSREGMAHAGKEAALFWKRA